MTDRLIVTQGYIYLPQSISNYRTHLIIFCNLFIFVQK
jgi:hypothetical protein